MSRKRWAAKRAGYRSGYEHTVIQSLGAIPFEYETEKIPYVVPESKHTYTPDLIFKKRRGGKMYLELKGKLDSDGRKKLLHVKASNPDMDLRLCFQNPNVRISKTSKTTYWMWAEKNGFLWCGPGIHPDWLREIAVDKPQKRR